MRLANCRLTIHFGHTLPMNKVTPAEVLLLTTEFQENAKEKPVYDLVELDPVTRPVSNEVERLTSRYGAFKVRSLFAGAIPILPLTFEEAVAIGMLIGNRSSRG